MPKLLTEISFNGAAVAAIQLGLRPSHNFTFVKCRITDFEGFIPFGAASFIVNSSGAVLTRLSNFAMTANPVIAHPCHVAAFAWCMRELHTRLNAMVGVGATHAGATDAATIGRMIHDWIVYDKPLSESDMVRLFSARRSDKEFSDAIRAVRMLFWEEFKAVRIGMTAVPPFQEIYVLEVDDTPWVLPSQKPSHLDKETL